MYIVAKPNTLYLCDTYVHCNYIQCNLYTFYMCPIFQCFPLYRLHLITAPSTVEKCKHWFTVVYCNIYIFTLWYGRQILVTFTLFKRVPFSTVYICSVVIAIIRPIPLDFQPSVVPEKCNIILQWILLQIVVQIMRLFSPYLVSTHNTDLNSHSNLKKYPLRNR